MKIKTVTITGADEFVNPGDLIKIEKRFPFVEWGILFSESKMGSERYPGREWLKTLFENKPQKLAAHMCGKYMRELLVGDKDIFSREPWIWENFQRVQLNFNVKNSQINLLEFFNSLKTWSVHYGIEQYIFQVNKSNDPFINEVLLPYSYGNSSFVYLFDGSGGNGILREWREPLAGQYCGYAGGLNDQNLEEQLLLIKEKAGDTDIWIDVETGVRTDNKLDLHKVCQFLKVAEKYV